MVKPADARIAKYGNKFDATVLAARATAGKVEAVRQFDVQASAYAQLESTIKNALESVLTTPTDLPWYLSCARQLQSKANKYGGLVLYNEAQNVKSTWVARGLDGDNIDIILGVLGISVSLYGT